MYSSLPCLTACPLLPPPLRAQRLCRGDVQRQEGLKSVCCPPAFPPWLPADLPKTLQLSEIKLQYFYVFPGLGTVHVLDQDNEIPFYPLEVPAYPFLGINHA